MNVFTTDIDLFWDAWESTRELSLAAQAEVFEDSYRDRGTRGLRDFWGSRIESGLQLASTISAHPRYYESLRSLTQDFRAQAVPILDGATRLKALLPTARLPDTYLLVGRMNSGGTVTDAGQLIGAEMFGLSTVTPMNELGDWHRAVLRPPDALPAIVLHETVHSNQRTLNPSSLLGKSIVEGAADFVVTLLVGKHSSPHHVFGRAHEAALWERFRSEMHSEDFSGWLYEGEQAKDRPADLGYYVGHQICASYFARQTTPAVALHDILTVQDFGNFLMESQYDGSGPAPDEFSFAALGS